MSVSTNSLSFPKGGGIKTFNYYSNCSVTISDNKDWISTSDSSGVVAVTVSNNTGDKRTGTITISNGDSTETVEII